MVHALIVDDDPEILESATRLAGDAGYTVAVAADWDQGLLLFKMLLPDLVIVDYNLPGSKHGLRFLFEACSLRPSARLILMSAYLNADDLASVDALGLVDRAVRKTDAVETARFILAELEDVEQRASREVNWSAVATATLKGQAVSTDALDKLDSFLRASRLGA